jgi:protein associated with RNAse G/E
MAPPSIASTSTSISGGSPTNAQVLDEDEFLDHSRAMRYSADVIERARSAVDDVLRLIRERAFPFDRHDPR